MEVASEVSLGNAGLKQVEYRCSLAKVNQELKKMNRVVFKMCSSVLESVQVIKTRIAELDPVGEYQALINSYFIYARDYGKNSVRTLDPQRKSTIIMKMIQLSIDWVSFICDDCIPTDRKTFRWCVLALEFSMEMIRGINIFLLTEEQFTKLKVKVARCMSLLISHFDIMGARSSEAEKNKLLKWTAQRHNIASSQNDDEYLNKVYHEEVMGQIKKLKNGDVICKKNFNQLDVYWMLVIWNINFSRYWHRHFQAFQSDGKREHVLDVVLLVKCFQQSTWILVGLWLSRKLRSMIVNRLKLLCP